MKSPLYSKDKGDFYKRKEVLFMPMIQVQLTVPVSKADNEKLHAALTKAAADIFQKDIAYIMVSVTGEKDIWMGPRSLEKGASVQVYMMGDIDQQKAGAYTAAVCKVLKEMYDIPGGDVYILFQSIAHWGSDSAMF